MIDVMSIYLGGQRGEGPTTERTSWKTFLVASVQGARVPNVCEAENQPLVWDKECVCKCVCKCVLSVSDPSLPLSIYGDNDVI